ncbi:MAG: DNA-processing protein DprA [Armatimonadetes bacterium]|nr:DNA-processing protein DprA [Armatimonadota bacterium]
MRRGKSVGSNRQLLLALAQVSGIGAKTLARIATRNELLGLSAREFGGLAAHALVEEYGIKQASAQEWIALRETLLERSAQLERRLDQDNIQFATPVDAHYPALLEEFPGDPPGLLFFHGNTKLLTSRTFGVLSSRKTSSRGLEIIEQLVEAGVLNGEVLVAGHDTPEYQRAAVVPLRWGAPRILVLDRGFYKVLGEELSDEPFRAARLWRYQFDARTDLVVSAVHPWADFHRSANKRRDHLVAGLCRRLDFIEVNEGGNMEVLMQSAAKVYRPVRISCHKVDQEEYLALGLLPLKLS